MDAATPSIRKISRKLLAIGSRAHASPRENAESVCETLRILLSRFAGLEGYASLLRRALVLAAAAEPSLKNISVGNDGRLRHTAPPEAGGGVSPVESPGLKLEGKAAAELVSQLLSLLVVFIGESLTLSLLREGWPNVSSSLDEGL